MGIGEWGDEERNHKGIKVYQGVEFCDSDPHPNMSGSYVTTLQEEQISFWNSADKYFSEKVEKPVMTASGLLAYFSRKVIL